MTSNTELWDFQNVQTEDTDIIGYRERSYSLKKNEEDSQKEGSSWTLSCIFRPE